MNKKVAKLILLISFFACPSWAAIQTHYIDGQSFIRVLDIAQTYQLDSQWDARMQSLSLSSAKLNINFLANERRVLVNSDVVFMDSPVKYWKGGFFVRQSFMGQIRSKMAVLPSSVLERKVNPSAWQVKQIERIKTIVLDPGHGGKDSGALGPQNVQEKHIVLEVSLKLRDLLVAQGFRVFMTRSTDVFIPLWKRSQMANSEEADLFISLHANAARDRSAHGLEVFYLSDEMDDYARAVASAENSVIKYEENSQWDLAWSRNQTKSVLRDLVFDEYRRESAKLSEHVLNAMVQGTKLKNRGVKSARFYVIKHTELPSILVEMGFVSNAREAQFLKKNSSKMAQSIFKGILSYKKEFERR